MKITRMLKFKKAKIDEKHYGYGNSTYNVISDGAIVKKIIELGKKYNAEIVRINLSDSDSWFGEHDCFIKIKAHKKDFINIVNDFMLYFIKYIQNVRY